jgi:hypothetical protein
MLSAWAPPGHPSKIIEFQTHSQDHQKSEKYNSRYSKTYQKDIQKSTGYHPVHCIRAKVKPNHNRRIYNVFSPSVNRSWHHFLTQTHQKTHLGTDSNKKSTLTTKNTQRYQKRLQSGTHNSSKINGNPTLDPKVSPLVSLWTPGSPTC